jgi:hypothetical protein
LYVNVAIAVVALAGGVTLLRHAVPPQRPKLDLIGTVLAAGGMFSLVYGFSNASMASGSAGWTQPATLGTLIGGAVLLVAFVLAERRVAHPLLPLRVVMDRDRGGAYTAMFLSAIGMFGVFLFLTYYLEQTLGYSAVRTGVAFLPVTVVLMLTAMVGNIVLLARVSARALIPSGLLLAGAGMALLTRIGLHSGYAADVLPSLLLIGLGLGLVFAPSFTLGTRGVGAGDAGVASATLNVAQQVGGSIGTSLLNTIATTAVSGYVTARAALMTSHAARQLVQGNALVHGYHVVFWVAAGVFAGAGALTALLLRSANAVPQESSEPAAVFA